ncbi:hypothetical protein ATY78_09835 [Rhizobium sp. R635]|uniref:hypothetical protein n=1 Tax=unclassified Rhizobium TaxID=2613769 RepID=UPI000B52DBDA|nr:hypothetical protein [Rhizobium sp. R635]OWV80027.1 hypothetical protein ATY78_09835 [Rhizobium sp. R635]
MIIFLRIFCAVLWRSILVLVLNTLVTYWLSHLAGSLLVQTDFLVKARLSLWFLPAGIIFAVLAARVGNADSVLLEKRSPMSFAQWGQTYGSLAGCAFLIVMITCVAALVAETDVWLGLRTLLPLPMFLLFWIAVSVWQAKSLSVHARNNERLSPPA